jgi:hypothetical protein
MLRSTSRIALAVIATLALGAPASASAAYPNVGVGVPPASLPNGAVTPPTGPPETPPSSALPTAPVLRAGSSAINAKTARHSHARLHGRIHAHAAASEECWEEPYGSEVKANTGWGANPAYCRGPEAAIFEVQVCDQLYYSGGWHNHVCKKSAGSYVTTNDFDCEPGYYNAIWGWFNSSLGTGAGYQPSDWYCN